MPSRFPQMVPVTEVLEDFLRRTYLFCLTLLCPAHDLVPSEKEAMPNKALKGLVKRHQPFTAHQLPGCLAEETTDLLASRSQVAELFG